MHTIPGCKIFFHPRNRGKGAALRTGFRHAQGDVILIQDADLEYDPGDYAALLKPIQEGKTNVVYGSRFIQKGFRPRNKLTYVGNIFLSFVTQMLYFNRITDTETCYKVFRKNVLNGIQLHSNGFEFEVEITAKILKNGNKIIEVPVSYYGRSHEEGKKLRPFKDGCKALYYLLYYRIFN